MKVITTMSLPQLVIVALAAAAQVCAITQTLQAALNCIKMQAFSAVIKAGFRGLQVPKDATTDEASFYRPTFVWENEARGQVWPKKFSVAKKRGTIGQTTDFKYTVQGDCPVVGYDETKASNCAAEIFPGSAEKFRNVRTAFSYAELEEIFKQTGEKATNGWCKD